MIMRAKKSSGTVRIYPVDGVSLHPWKPIEQEVSAADWRLLSAFKPPPFTDQPPGGEFRGPSTYIVGEHSPEVFIPNRRGRKAPTDKPTEPTGQVGSSDSEGSE